MNPSSSRVASTSSLASNAGDVTSPPLPPSLMRNTSSGLARSGDPSLAKTRARNLLRDYYSLPDQKGKDKEASSSPTTSTVLVQSSESEQGSSRVPIQAQVVFDELVKTAAVSELLKRANDLVGEIGELEGERQSLVYNHHHELVEASGTIGKMKASAETLDSSLDALQVSFSSISSLTASLASRPPLPPPRLALPNTYDPALHLLALLSIPRLLEASKRPEADRMWGEWEPALRSWEEAGVEGIKEISSEARDVLRATRQSGAVADAGVIA